MQTTCKLLAQKYGQSFEMVQSTNINMSNLLSRKLYDSHKEGREEIFMLMLKTLGKRSKDFFIDSKTFYLSLYEESCYTGVTNQNFEQAISIHLLKV